ncbi:helix-turn-helix domain-containing protein [Azospira oryzae]|uniref:helix-turn-helix domain-containing protein n=1 Tax=Azospira oryzae TaxID=146939 RepID=UPI0012FEB5C2|nr:helix-turn-helix transcriptional regulator [Azospira oryzae]
MTAPLARQFARFRASRGESLDRIGAVIGVAGSHLSEVERGKRYPPPLTTLKPLINYLSLTHEEVRLLIQASEQSPKKLRVPPDAPEEAFIFVARLLRRWGDLAPQDFNRLSDFVESLSRSICVRQQPRR